MGKQLIELCNVINLLVALDSLLFTHMPIAYITKPLVFVKVALRWPIDSASTLFLHHFVRSFWCLNENKYGTKPLCNNVAVIPKYIRHVKQTKYSFLLISYFCRACSCFTLTMTSQSIAAIEAYVDWMAGTYFIDRLVLPLKAYNIMFGVWARRSTQYQHVNSNKSR